ncbi:MAG: YbjN domain-containing protein [Deltaproteobacteria bacterium]|nr:YbjN domain-containing protein [Deltaproteobacteria bacterium]
MGLFTHIAEMLTNEEWGFEPGPSATSLATGFEGANGRFVAVVAVREEEQQLVFYAYAPDLTAPDQRIAMMELVTRMNLGMMIGNFELDLDDGEVRFKVGVDAEAIEDPRALVPAHLGTCLRTLDLYLPAIEAVQSGTASPSHALDLVEVDDEDEVAAEEPEDDAAR